MKAWWMMTVAAVFAVGLVGSAEAAGDAAAGEAKAKSCAACHGADGKGKNNNPPLAGKPEADIAKAMHDYKSGARDHAMMKRLSAKLSDEDIADLAAYYASLN